MPVLHAQFLMSATKVTKFRQKNKTKRHKTLLNNNHYS